MKHISCDWCLITITDQHEPDMFMNGSRTRGQPLTTESSHSINNSHLPLVCTGSHRFPSVHVGWQTCLRSEEFGLSEPA